MSVQLIYLFAAEALCRAELIAAASVKVITNTEAETNGPSAQSARAVTQLVYEI